jgi:uncharacterized protein
MDLALAWRDTSPLYVLGGVLLGGLVGELLAIEDRLAALGDSIQRRVEAARGSPSPVSEAFFDASLLFCVGPLAVVGAIQVTDVKVGNFLPALIFAPALVGIVSLVD